MKRLILAGMLVLAGCRMDSCATMNAGCAKRDVQGTGCVVCTTQNDVAVSCDWEATRGAP